MANTVVRVTELGDLLLGAEDVRWPELLLLKAVQQRQIKVVVRVLLLNNHDALKPVRHLAQLRARTNGQSQHALHLTARPQKEGQEQRRAANTEAEEKGMSKQIWSMREQQITKKHLFRPFNARLVGFGVSFEQVALVEDVVQCFVNVVMVHKHQC